MPFPLQKRIVIPGRDFEGHIKAGLGGGVDYRAEYVPFVVSHDGFGSHYIGPQGGLTYRLLRSNGERIEFLHLKSVTIPDGKVKAGSAGGITGNSGLLHPAAPPYKPHLHIQVFNNQGQRIDPEEYNWEQTLTLENMLRTYKGTIYALVAGYWMAIATSYQDFLQDFGGQIAPEMTEAQFKAFPLHKRTIK